MRKKSLKAVMTVAVVAVAGYGVYANKTEEQAMSDNYVGACGGIGLWRIWDGW